jgi:hypothetical protein
MRNIIKTAALAAIIASAACGEISNPAAPTSTPTTTVATDPTPIDATLSWTLPYTGPRLGCVVRQDSPEVPDRQPDTTEQVDAETIRVYWRRANDILHAEFRLQAGSWRLCFWDIADA